MRTVCRMALTVGLVVALAGFASAQPPRGGQGRGGFGAARAGSVASAS